MTCPCPKCTAPIDQDLTQLQDGAAPVSCPSCKAKVLIQRESFARRAYRRSSQISCASCGNTLGNSLNCPSCGTLYPDYIVADTPDAVRRRQRAGSKWEPFKGVEFSLRPTRRNDGSSYVPNYTAATAAHDEAAAHRTRSLVVGAVALVLGLAVLAGGVNAYSKHQKTQRYAASFVGALFNLKTGMDMSAEVSRRMAEDWKKKQDTGGGAQSQLLVEEEARLTKVKGEVEKSMLKLQPPAKFVEAHEQLQKLNGIYARTHALAVAPAGSPAESSAAVVKLQDEFMKVARGLKAGLPPELAESLKKGQARYIKLRDL